MKKRKDKSHFMDIVKRNLVTVQSDASPKMRFSQATTMMTQRASAQSELKQHTALHKVNQLFS